MSERNRAMLHYILNVVRIKTTKGCPIITSEHNLAIVRFLSKFLLYAIFSMNDLNLYTVIVIRTLQRI